MHALLAGLPVCEYVTTNYDGLLERALSAPKGASPPSVLPPPRMGRRLCSPRGALLMRRAWTAVGFDIAPFVVFPLFCAGGAGLSVGRTSCWTRSVWGGRHPTRCGMDVRGP